MKRFYNRWSHSWQYAECGKCPSCQQQKAYKRTQRIKNASYNGYTPLFVTLTYRNCFIPFIRKSDLRKDTPFLPVYRDSFARKVRISSDYKISYSYKRQLSPISTLDRFKYRLSFSHEQIKQLSFLKGEHDKDKVGVLYFKDLQDFEKRLRVNLLRHYRIDKPIYTVKVSEYGPTTSRPHFHLIVYVPSESVDECTAAIDASWPYDSKKYLTRRVEIAKNAANYVSSYVNRGSDFSQVLSALPFRPRHSFSRLLGIQNDTFSLESLCESIRQGNIGYLKLSPCGDGTTRSSFIPFPRYFSDYYFRQFKGYSRLTHSQIRDLIIAPNLLRIDKSLQSVVLCLEKPKRFRSEEIGFYRNHSEYYNDYSTDFKLIDSVINHIQLRVKRFLSDFVYYDEGERCKGLPDNVYNRELYADYLYSFWRTTKSNSYRCQFDGLNDFMSVLQCYYNLDDVLNFKVHSVDISLMLHRFKDRGIYTPTDPNLFNKVIQQTYRNESFYFSMLKRKKVTNESMSAQHINV